MSRSVLSLVLVPTALLHGCGEAPRPADLVLLNGKIVTVDSERPEVKALAAHRRF